MKPLFKAAAFGGAAYCIYAIGFESDALAQQLDRLGRSTIHLLQLLDDLRKRGVDFQAITQGIDTTTSVGRMLYGQLAVFAEFEREQIRERTKAGMAAAKKRGVHIGRPRKLTDRQIINARRKLSAPSITLCQVAKDYGVAPLTLARAISSFLN